MSLGNTTTIAYKGVVSIDMIINGKVYSLQGYNAGLSALQKTFARFLVGQSVTTEDLPEYLDLRGSSDNGSTWTSYLNAIVPLSGKVWEFDSAENVNNWIAKFTAAIAAENLKGITDTYIYKLVLCAGTLNSLVDLAELTVLAKDLSKITAGTQAAITWKMQLVNA